MVITIGVETSKNAALRAEIAELTQLLEELRRRNELLEIALNILQSESRMLFLAPQKQKIGTN